jgi:predicted pyridoxine 5'-phosphate oxidase superfamily flavin-nucleotide-binding protein
MTNEKSSAGQTIASLDGDGDTRYRAERLAHKRFGVEDFWRTHNFDAAFLTTLPAGLAAYLPGLPFFFIATANAGGECDCSYRGREHDAAGRPYALVKIIDAKTLLFPDYSGNRYFNSLGNILANGHIGMLFIDFERQRRVRINGQASIIDDHPSYATEWPLAHRYVSVSVEQVFGNCRARIPRMQLVTATDTDQDS